MIIGFGGALGSGKDTAGRRLAQMVDMPAQQISFASKLKASVAALLDVDVADFDQWKNDPDAKLYLAIGYETFEETVKGTVLEQPKITREFTFREILQRYGTEAHRDVFGQDFWVDQALDAATDPSVLYYVTDVRFDNEVEGIKARGGEVVQILTGREPEIEESRYGVFPTDFNGHETTVYFNKETGVEIHASEVPPKGFTRRILNHIRDDDFAWLDHHLRLMALATGLPLKQEATA